MPRNAGELLDCLPTDGIRRRYLGLSQVLDTYPLENRISDSGNTKENWDLLNSKRDGMRG